MRKKQLKLGMRKAKAKQKMKQYERKLIEELLGFKINK